MNSSVENHQAPVKKSRGFIAKAAGLAMLAAACSAPHAKEPQVVDRGEASAQCDALDVSISAKGNHDVTFTPKYTLLSGAKLNSVTYILDQPEPGRPNYTVYAADEPTVTFEHQFPNSMHDVRVTAIINYAAADGRVYGAIDMCNVPVQLGS